MSDAPTDPGSEAGAEPVRRLAGLGLELPERGTGARAARRAGARPLASQPHEAPPEPSSGAPPTEGPDEWRQALDAQDRRDALPKRARSPEPDGAAPSRAVRRPSRRWLAGFSAGLVVCVLAAGALAWLGLTTLRDSRAGRIVTSASPDEPGFEGFLEPTPTLAVRVTYQGALDAAYVLSLGSGDVGGGVLLIPPRTLIGSGQFGTLAITHAFGGDEEAVRGSVEVVAGFGLDELVTIDEARWAELVAPVAPLVVDNPDELDGFPIGRLELAADQVAPFLAARAEGESDLGRLVRHELVWEAWLSQVGTTGAVPGELATGLGRFVRGLAAGPHLVRSLPAEEVPAEGGAPEFQVDERARAALITTLVPYPRGTANAPRTLVRLLDGTGDADHVPRLAPQVVASDASIVVVGNADRFDYGTTQIRYHRPDQKRAAERLARDLGAGQVIEDVRPIDTFDVTIVLGSDL